MAWFVWVPPFVLSASYALYLLRRILIYDITYLCTRWYAVRRISRKATKVQIEGLVYAGPGRYRGYSTAIDDLHWNIRTTFDLAPKVTLQERRDSTVWPTLLLELDHLLFDRHKLSDEADRKVLREHDLAIAIRRILDNRREDWKSLV